MLMMPRRVKFRREHRGRRTGVASRGNELAFGEFGLQAMEACWLTARQIEAGRVAITRHVRRGGKLWVKVFPTKPVTKKPAETRMGKGKGSPELWVAVVQPGRVLFELAGVPRDVAREAIKRAQYKLPIRTRFVERSSGDGI
jgi:large subunit ribosomal protein L16